MTSVKVLVCYHKKDILFQDDILTPIHVGRAAAKRDRNHPDITWLLESMIGDDTGQNISLKNASYNELTAVYWAWKNYAALGNPEYIGLAHYRRHFALKHTDLPEIVYRGEDPKEFLAEIGYSPEKLRRLLAGKDFAAHMSRTGSVYEQYIQSHRPEKLKLAVRILTELHPEYAQTAEEYLAGSRGFFCNMFLMKREIFFDYCSFLFPVLEEFEKRTTDKNERLFVSERLTGIYLTYQIRKKKRYRTFPVGIFAGRVTIPVVIPFREERLFDTAVLMTSLLSRADPLTAYEIFLISKHPVSEAAEKALASVGRNRGNCRMVWLNTERERDCPTEEDCLYLLGELLPGIPRCLYLRVTAAALSDPEKFWRVCAADEYDIAGIPAKEYDLLSGNREILPDVMLIRADHFRKRQVRERAAHMREKGMTGKRLFAGLFAGRIAYLPPWTAATESGRPWDTEGIPMKERCAGRVFWVWDRGIPRRNPFIPGGSLWWEAAAEVPAVIPLPGDLLSEAGRNPETAAAAEHVVSEKCVPSGRDAWRGYSLLGKLRFFYHHNGLKNTVKYGIDKLSGSVRSLITRRKGRW